MTTEMSILVRARDEATAVFRRVSSAASGMSSRFSRVGSQLASIGRAARVGLAIGTAAAVVGLKQTIEAASDLNESVSKVGVVFGKNARDIMGWSKTSSTAMGISQQAALEAAGTFGNLFSAMGVGKKPTLDMSKSIVELSSDLASFNNQNPEDVLLALRAGLVGEAEPLRKFGINISAAATQAEALSLGIAKVGEELTPAQKAQANYSLIMKQSTTAQGDFARTSDGVANRQRIVAAQFENVKATIGNALLPIWGKLLGAVSGAISWLGRMGEILGKSGLSGVLDHLGERVSAVWKTMTDWFKGLSAGVKGLIAIGAILVAFFAPIVVVIGAIVGVTILLIKHWDAVKAAFMRVFDAVRPFAEFLGRVFFRALRSIWGAIGKHLIPAMRQLWRAIAPIVKILLAVAGALVTAFIFTAGKVLPVVIRVMSGIIRVVAGVTTGISKLVGWVSKAVGWLRDRFVGAWLRVKDVATGIWESVRGAAISVFNSIAGAWNSTVGRLSFRAPSWVPFIGGKGWDVPDVPTFETGGLVARTGMALVHKGEVFSGVNRDFGPWGSRGPVVVKLDRRRVIRETDFARAYSGSR